MTGREAVEAVMEAKGTTQTELAKLAGYPGQSTVSEKLKRDIKISVFVKLIEAMGYEVVVRKKPKGPRKADEFVLSVSDSSDK